MGAAAIMPDPRIVISATALPAEWMVAGVALVLIVIILLAVIGLALDVRDFRRAGEAARMQELADAAVEGLIVCNETEIDKELTRREAPLLPLRGRQQHLCSKPRRRRTGLGLRQPVPDPKGLHSCRYKSTRPVGINCRRISLTFRLKTVRPSLNACRKLHAVIDGPQPIVLLVALRPREDPAQDRSSTDNVGIRFKKTVRPHQLDYVADTSDRIRRSDNSWIEPADRMHKVGNADRAVVRWPDVEEVVHGSRQLALDLVDVDARIEQETLSSYHG
jgi:hypothetical protein